MMIKRKMKKLAIAASSILLALSLLISGCSSSTGSEDKNPDSKANEQASEKPIELKYATYNSANHYMGVIDSEFIARLDQQSNGRVKVTPFWEGTLVKPTEWFQETIRGSADIVQGPPGLEKERFKVNTAVTYFSYGLNSGEALRGAFTELFNSNSKLKDEYKEVKPLIWITAGDSWVHTTKKPIRKAEDFKGLNIRVADDPSFALVKALGANPVRMPISEAYSALEKGIVDGIITGADPLKTFRFAEVTKYSTLLPYWTPWVVSKVINNDTWNSLPADVQKLIEDNARWWEDQLLERQGAMIKEGLDLAKERGNEIIELSTEEKDKIKAVLEDNAKKIANEVGADDIFDQARSLVEKYNK